MKITKHEIARLQETLETVGVCIMLLVSEDLNYLLIDFPNILRYAIVFGLIVLRWRRFLYVSTRDILLLLLVVMAFLSGFWSYHPSVTFDEVEAAIRTSLLGAYLATRYSPRELLRVLSLTCGVALVLNLMAIFLRPELAVSFTNNAETWQGIYTQKQYLGRMMTLSVLVFCMTAFDNPKYRRLLFLAAGISVLVLLLTRSKTSLSCLLLVVSFLPIYKAILQNYKLRTILLVTGFAVFANLVVWAVGNYEFLIVDVLSKPLDLSGRLPIWEMTIERGMERPWLGYGYSAFWTSDASDTILSTTWAGLNREHRFHAHNGFIDLFVQLGLIGLFLFLAQFSMLCLRVAKWLTFTRSIASFFVVLFIISMFVFNTTETITILSHNNIFWVLYVAVSLMSVMQLDRYRRGVYVDS